MANLTEEQKKLKIPTIEELHKQMGLGNPTGFERFLYKQMVKDFNRGVNPSGIVAPASIRDYWKAINSPRVTPIVDYTNQKASFAGVPDTPSIVDTSPIMPTPQTPVPDYANQKASFAGMPNTMNTIMGATQSPTAIELGMTQKPKIQVGQPLGTQIPQPMRQGPATQQVATLPTGAEKMAEDEFARKAMIYRKGPMLPNGQPMFPEGELVGYAYRTEANGTRVPYQDAALQTRKNIAEADRKWKESATSGGINWNKVYEARKKVMAGYPQMSQAGKDNSQNIADDMRARSAGYKTVEDQRRAKEGYAAERRYNSPQAIAERQADRDAMVAASQGKATTPESVVDNTALFKAVEADMDSLNEPFATGEIKTKDYNKFLSRTDVVTGIGTGNPTELVNKMLDSGEEALAPYISWIDSQATPYAKKRARDRVANFLLQQLYLKNAQAA